MKISATKVFEFEAAHHLPGYDGPCGNLHGHSYKLEVTVARVVSGPITGVIQGGMVMDFSTIKRMVKDNIIDKLDHSNLNEKGWLYPTAENMILTIWGEIEKLLCYEPGLYLHRLRLWETSTSYIELMG